MKLRWAMLFAAAAGALGFGSPAVATLPGCAPAEHPGGEWRMYGHDLANSRNQPAEDGINASNVATLGMKWVFRATTAVPATSSGGGFSNTPVIADGCAYLATDSGWVFAVNADTGTGPNPGGVIWRTRLDSGSQSLIGAGIVGSPVVHDGVVYVGVMQPGRPNNATDPTDDVGPYVAALDQATGAVLWRTQFEGNQQNSGVVASPVLLADVEFADGSFRPLIFQGFMGNEGGSVPRGGFVLIDGSRDCGGSTLAAITCTSAVGGATGGTIIKKTYTISDAEWGKGYRGASIWCTSAADPASLYVYACGGNPASKKIEARYSNALLKADVNPLRATFGEIVDSYKGEVDQYYPGLERQPACDLLGDTLVVVWSLACLQLDLDFGASPNLYTDSSGNQVLGALQKSGVYHALFTDHMARSWTTVVGTPCFPCNAASTAVADIDGSPEGTDLRVFADAYLPGQMVSLTADNGRYRWAMPHGVGTNFQPVSSANGVVYGMDNAAVLTAIDAQLGVVALKRPLAADVGTPVAQLGSAGVAIARNTVYAATSQYVVAYSL